MRNVTIPITPKVTANPVTILARPKRPKSSGASRRASTIPRSKLSRRVASPPPSIQAPLCTTRESRPRAGEVGIGGEVRTSAIRFRSKQRAGRPLHCLGLLSGRGGLQLPEVFLLDPLHHGSAIAHVCLKLAGHGFRDPGHLVGGHLFPGNGTACRNQVRPPLKDERPIPE